MRNKYPNSIRTIHVPSVYLVQGLEMMTSRPVACLGRTMRNLLKTAAFLAALSAGSAQATVFDFSYTFFSAGTAITGFLSGTLVGYELENVSDIHVFADGVPLSSVPFSAVGKKEWWEPIWDNPDSPAVSPYADANNFLFFDPTQGTSFSMARGPGWRDAWFRSPSLNIDTFDLLYCECWYFGSEEMPVFPYNDGWSLVARSELPEPRTLSLLFFSLIGMGAVRRFSRAPRDPLPSSENRTGRLRLKAGKY